jgi:hypothetical protein
VLLPYCVAETDAPGLAKLALPAGFRGAAVRTVEHAGLRCFVSEVGEPPEKFSREDALAFHRVVRAVFNQAAVIPFRFPTFIPNEDELDAFLDPHAAEYREELQRLREFVQMEIHINLPAPAGGAKGAKPAGEPGAGAEYLHERAEERAAMTKTIEAAQVAIGDKAHGWHVRETGHGWRVVALVARSDVEEFRARAAKIDAKAGSKAESPYKIVVSGPWPAVEFMDALHSGGE